MITSIIFDLDDLIVNSSLKHFEAYEWALKKFGVPCATIPPDLRRSIYGMRIKEIMELLASHFKMNVDVSELTKVRNEHFLQLVKEGVEPMPGLHALLKNVENWGLKRALASSGIKNYVSEVLDQLKLSNFFGAVVTGEDVVNAKPAPDCFLLAAKKLGEPRENCAVLEDATKGLMAAKKAGMFAVGVKNSVIDSEQDMSMADRVVNRLDEITLEMLGVVR